ncbi:MAG: hypothetical protein AAGF11_51285 [Myxococcota bacterium]
MSDRPDLNDDFLDVLHALVDAGVEFLVVGAHALAAHGVVRATGDLDILVKPSSANAARIIEGLRAFGAPLSAHGVGRADFAKPGTVYQLGLPPRRIDILTSISGVTFDDAKSHAQTVHVGTITFHVPGRAALLANKKATGRPKDLEDARRLEQLGD